MSALRVLSILFVVVLSAYCSPVWADSVTVTGQWSNPPVIPPPAPNPFASADFSLTFTIPTPISSFETISTDSFGIGNITGSYSNNGATTTFAGAEVTFLDAALGGGFNLDVFGLFQSQPFDEMTFDFNGQSDPVLYTGPLSNPTLLGGILALSGFGQYHNDLYFTGTKTAFTNGGATYEASPVPEPGTLFLLSSGMLLILWRTRKRDFAVPTNDTPPPHI